MHAHFLVVVGLMCLPSSMSFTAPLSVPRLPATRCGSHSFSRTVHFNGVSQTLGKCLRSAGTIGIMAKLPQDDDEEGRKARAAEVKNAQSVWKYTYDYNIKVPYLERQNDEIPSAELPTGEWALKAVLAIAKFLVSLLWPSGNLGMRVSVFLWLYLDFVAKTTFLSVKALLTFKPFLVVRELPKILEEVFKEDSMKIRATAVEDFEFFGLFDLREYQMERAKGLEDDKAFCRKRLQGPNPMTLQPCAPKTLSELKIPAEVKEAVKGRALFCVDYRAVAEYGKSEDDVTGLRKFSMGPFALFAAEGATIEVLGIQPTEDMVMVTPKDGKKWTVAKTVFNSVDGDYHEGFMHLGDTHLVVETNIVAVHRTLPSGHPVYKLMHPHFEGTAFINDNADRGLISPGGIVDQLVSQPIEKLNIGIGQHVLDTIKDDFSFPAKLKNRGMDSVEFEFPYKEDGQLIWDATLNWVRDYLSIFYGEKGEKIPDDYELQNFIKEVSSATGGKVFWMANYDNSVESLARFLAAVIFTGSAQHAGVNFPQYSYMSFTPSYPLGMYAEATESSDDVTKFLPPLAKGLLQAAVGGFLGGVYHTTLGDYKDGWFKEGDVGAALSRFQAALRVAEDKINARNQHRAIPYTTLLPSKIPQSINI